MGIFDKFKKGFQKSASAFSSGLKEIIVKNITSLKWKDCHMFTKMFVIM